MSDAISLLQQGIKREKVSRIPVPDVAEWPVLTLFHVPIGNCHRNLDVGIGVAPAGDEVALQLPDAAYG